MSPGAEAVVVEGEGGVEVKAQMSTINRMAALIAQRRGETAEAKATAATTFGPGSWSVIAHEAGLQRVPPNHFDLDIYRCRQGVLALETPAARPCQRHALPGIEGSFSLTDVLSAAECSSMMALTEAVGYRPDVPLSSPMDERAHNVVLFASEEQNEALFARVRELLPQEIGGAKLCGLNRRWRIYRYKEGNAYRKHLDGAWPSSGMRAAGDGRDEYVYDAYGGSTRSRFTFIVYLNDDFEGGDTTFFVPKAGAEGTLEARPVRPRVGSATVFPHGETGVPLLHEGSPVLKGMKYLLRTDVVYATGEASEAMKNAKRLRGLARQLGGLGGKDLLEEATEGVANGKAGGKKLKVIKSGTKTGRFAANKQGGKPSKSPGAEAREEGAAKKPFAKKSKKGERMKAGAGKRGGGGATKRGGGGGKHPDR